jgi:hypothetical protein
MGGEFSADEGDVERRIEGEFMRRLQESEVPFDIVEVMEELIDKPDLGGTDEIVERIEAEVFDNGD